MDCFMENFWTLDNTSLYEAVGEPGQKEVAVPFFISYI